MNPKQKLTPKQILDIVNAYRGPNLIKEALDKENLVIKSASCPSCLKKDVKKVTVGTTVDGGREVPAFGEILPLYNLYCNNCEHTFTPVG